MIKISILREFRANLASRKRGIAGREYRFIREMKPF